MDDVVAFADDRATLRRWRREIETWLWDERRLRLNARKGHIRPAALPQPYLGHRITRRGHDLGSTAARRFRRQLPELIAAGDRERLRRTLDSWMGTMSF